MKNQEELETFIKRKLKKGYPQGELINDLLREGYPEEDIKKAINNPPAVNGNSKKINSLRNSTIPLWFVLTTGLGIAGLSIINLFKNSTLGWGFIVIGIGGLLVKLLVLFDENQRKKT